MTDTQQRPKILVIEDDIWTAEQHVRVLRKAGYQASYSLDVISGMDQVDSYRPNALIIDVFLAGSNAFTFLHEIRSYADLASIPIILCTNAAETINDYDVTAYGITNVLDKTSMYPEDLIRAVRKVTI